MVRELVLRMKNGEVVLPVQEVSFWEEVDEEGFVVEEGYTYHTPYGKIITRITDRGEDVLHAQLDWERVPNPHVQSLLRKEREVA